MEVLEILNDLEEMVEESTHIPMTGRVVIDADELLDYIDRIRAVLPDEIKQAKWITKEHNRIIKDAEAEALRLLDNAQTKQLELAGESEIAKYAEVKANEIIQKAQTVATEINMGAKVYADDVLKAIESNLERLISEVRNGRNELNEKKPINNK